MSIDGFGFTFSDNYEYNWSYLNSNEFYHSCINSDKVNVINISSSDITTSYLSTSYLLGLTYIKIDKNTKINDTGNFHNIKATNVSYFTTNDYEAGLYIIGNSYFGDQGTTADLVMIYSYDFKKLINNNCTYITKENYHVKISSPYTGSKLNIYKILC